MPVMAPPFPLVRMNWVPSLVKFQTTRATTLRLQKPTDLAPSAGLSTLDILLAQADLLGIQPLNNPLAQMAADANGSGNVSTLDLLLIQQVILQLADGMPVQMTGKWCPTNPGQKRRTQTPLKRVRSFLRVAPLNIVDFTAIKRGDVNFSLDQSSMMVNHPPMVLTWNPPPPMMSSPPD